MTTEKKKELWGEELFNAFANHIDENGWLTEDWAGILDKEMPDFDEDYNDNENKKEVFRRMYNLDYEESADGSMLRPVV